MELYHNSKINGQVKKNLASNFDFSIHADQIKVNFRHLKKKKVGIFLKYFNGLDIL